MKTRERFSFIFPRFRPLSWVSAHVKFEYWAPRTTDVQVLWSLPRRTGDLCYFIFSKLLNSLNVNQSDLTVQECPHCCHDSKGSILFSCQTRTSDRTDPQSRLELAPALPLPSRQQLTVRWSRRWLLMNVKAQLFASDVRYTYEISKQVSHSLFDHGWKR